jgi:hypothetical protein
MLIPYIVQKHLSPILCQASWEAVRTQRWWKHCPCPPETEQTDTVGREATSKWQCPVVSILPRFELGPTSREPWLEMRVRSEETWGWFQGSCGLWSDVIRTYPGQSGHAEGTGIEWQKDAEISLSPQLFLPSHPLTLAHGLNPYLLLSNLPDTIQIVHCSNNSCWSTRTTTLCSYINIPVTSHPISSPCQPPCPGLVIEAMVKIIGGFSYSVGQKQWQT